MSKQFDAEFEIRKIKEVLQLTIQNSDMSKGSKDSLFDMLNEEQEEAGIKTEKKLSINALSWMEFLGNFTTTSNASQRMIKGYINDGDVYIDSGELRELSLACIEISDWLDDRANRINEKIPLFENEEVEASRREINFLKCKINELSGW